MVEIVFSSPKERIVLEKENTRSFTALSVNHKDET